MYRLIIAIALVLLACVRFEYNSASWSVSVPGLPGGLVVLGIIALVLLYRIVGAVQDACIARGLLAQRPQSKWDLLIPVAIVAAMIHGNWTGPMIRGMKGDAVPEWELTWSDPKLAAPFIAAVVIVAFLLRVLALAKAIALAPPFRRPMRELEDDLPRAGGHGAGCQEEAIRKLGPDR